MARHRAQAAGQEKPHTDGGPVRGFTHPSLGTVERERESLKAVPANQCSSAERVPVLRKSSVGVAFRPQAAA